MHSSFPVDALMNTMNPRFRALTPEGVVFQDIGSTVSFPHATTKWAFTLNPRVQAFMTSRRMQERFGYVNATQSHAGIGIPSLLSAMRCARPAGRNEVHVVHTASSGRPGNACFGST